MWCMMSPWHFFFHADAQKDLGDHGESTQMFLTQWQLTEMSDISEMDPSCLPYSAQNK